MNVAPVSGAVRVKVPGADQFVPLSAPSQVPVGTQIDATRGRVEVTAARAGGITDTSQFYEGVFQIGPVHNLSAWRRTRRAAARR